MMEISVTARGFRATLTPDCNVRIDDIEKNEHAGSGHWDGQRIECSADLSNEQDECDAIYSELETSLSAALAAAPRAEPVHELVVHGTSDDVDRFWSAATEVWTSVESDEFPDHGSNLLSLSASQIYNLLIDGVDEPHLHHKHVERGQCSDGSEVLRMSSYTGREIEMVRNDTLYTMRVRFPGGSRRSAAWLLSCALARGIEPREPYIDALRGRELLDLMMQDWEVAAHVAAQEEAQ